MSSDPVINEDTHYARVECPHCKNTHNVKLAKEEKVIDPIPLSDALCGCAIHTDNSVRFIDFVFDGPPGPYGPRLVEVENQFGQSTSMGKWERRKDGMWVLRMPLPDDDNKFRMQLVESFEKHLTADAKKVYNTPLKSTVIETLNCQTCGGVEFMPTEEEKAVYCGYPFGLNVQGRHRPGWDDQARESLRGTNLTPEKIRAMPHLDHTFERRVKLVQFMSQNFNVSLAASLVAPEAVRREFDMRAEWMAKAFNRGVQNGWLAWGTLLQCHVMPLAVFAPMRSFHMTVMVGSNLSMDELNEKFGKRYFVKEGELGPMEGAWPEIFGEPTT